MNFRVVVLLALLACMIHASLHAQTGPPKPVVTFGTPDGRWKAEFFSVALSRDGSMLLFGSGPQELTLVNTRTNGILKTIALEKDSPIYRPKFTDDGTGIYTVYENKYTLYDVKSGKKIARIDLPAPRVPGGGVLGPKNWYFPTADGKKVAVSVLYFDNQPIRIWDVLADRSLGEIKPKQNRDGHFCSWSGDGSLLAISGYRHDKKNPDDEATNEFVDFYDGKTFKPQGRIHAGERKWVGHHQISPDGKYVCVESDNTPRNQLFDVVQKKKIHTLEIADGEFALGGFYFTDDGKKVGLQMESGGMYAWDTITGRLLGKRKGPPSTPGGMGFVSEKEILAASIEKNDVLLTNIMEDEKSSPDLNHRKTIFATAFTKDGKYFYSGGLEQKVIRWDATTGKALAVVVQPPERVFQDWTPEWTFFGPEGDYLFAGYSSSAALARLDGKGGATFNIKGKYRANWSHVKIAEDGKTVYAWGKAQQHTETGLRLASNAYACHWAINGDVLKEGVGRIDQNPDDYFKTNFAEAKFLVHPIDDPKNPSVVLGKEIADPKDLKKMLTPIAIKSRDGVKVLLELNVPLAHPKGISFSADSKRVAIPLTDHTIAVYQLP